MTSPAQPAGGRRPDIHGQWAGRRTIVGVEAVTEELAAAVARARAEALQAGELRPAEARRGALTLLPEALRDPAAEDLRSGAFRRAVEQLTGADDELRDC